MSAVLSACNGHAVYSNESRIAGRYRTVPAINGSMRVGTSKRWRGAALNTPVLLQAYHSLLARAPHLDHDWVVKLDLDTAVSIPRLRTVLRLFDPANPIALSLKSWMVDGKYHTSVDGPLIAMSRAAFDRYSKVADKCETSIDYSDIGDDYYLGLCMQDRINLVPLPGFVRDTTYTRLPNTSRLIGFHGLKRVTEYHTRSQQLRSLGPITSSQVWCDDDHGKTTHGAPSLAGRHTVPRQSRKKNLHAPAPFTS